MFSTRYVVAAPKVFGISFGVIAVNATVPATLKIFLPQNSVHFQFFYFFKVHDFLRTCLCCTVAQGYGLTETAGGVSLADGADLSTGRVGHPLQGVRARMVDWEEGGYRAKEGR